MTHFCKKSYIYDIHIYDLRFLAQKLDFRAHKLAFQAHLTNELIFRAHELAF